MSDLTRPRWRGVAARLRRRRQAGRRHPRARARLGAGLHAAAITAAAIVAVPAGPLAQAPVGPVQMPPVTVTAQKEPAEAQKLPVSVTAVPAQTIDHAGIRTVSDAALYAPNTIFTEFSARKISNATFRGVGSSPANAGITTMLDGVPQLNTNSSSIELLDVEQIEFVRGPQSALFGRNTLGGLVNISTRRPGLAGWSGRMLVPFATHDGRGVRASVSGPLNSGTLGFGATLDYTERDGFTRNTLTGNDLDSRSAFAGKAQLVWAPSSGWESRLIVSGERARDGDYALGDLAALRESRFEVTRDFEGRTERDLVGTTFMIRRPGPRFTFSMVTGLVRWETRDLTDLDYTPAPLATRDNREDDRQLTHEMRLSSSTPRQLSDGLGLQWQTGLFVFTQSYGQNAVNSYGPAVLSPQIPLGLDQHIPQAELEDVGVGVFGQATLTIRQRLDVTAGARFDYELKDARIRTFFSPAIPGLPASNVAAEKSFNSVSPQLGIAFHLQPQRMVYASVAEGFKAGGFNPSSPPGSEIYGEEQAWHAEAGWKSSWAGGRVTANAAGFFIDWQDIQLNLPDPLVPGQFYIANVGAATSRGVEVEVQARPAGRVLLFGSLGYTRARFKGGSLSGGEDVGGRKLPFTPGRTGMIGAEVANPIGRRFSLVGRVESVHYGAFHYDNANTAQQDAYGLTNLRAIIRSERLTVEAWLRNAFNTFYVPVAFAYGAFASSGFVGEPGKPRTFGVTAGVGF